MRVLIVDDEVKMASVIRRGLRDHEMVVDVAVRREDALRTAGATECDAIVSDVKLSGMDGFQVDAVARSFGVDSIETVSGAGYGPRADGERSDR